MRRIRAGRAAALLWMALAGRAFGWGDEGHHIVAMIAEARLSAEARQQIDTILGNDGPCTSRHTARDKMVCASLWADGSRFTTHKKTYNWHFVDMSLQSPAYDEGTHCTPHNQTKKGRCGIFGLDHTLRILRQELHDPNITRAQALMFVIHIVGDLHQPLHTVDEDVGGNFTLVQYYGIDTNLHKVWDTKILASRMMLLHESESGYAARLEDQADASDAQGDAVQWLNEAHAIAIQDAYGNVFKYATKTPDGRPVLRKAYFKHNWPLIDRQLQRAGLRLAKVLNDTLH